MNRKVRGTLLKLFAVQRFLDLNGRALGALNRSRIRDDLDHLVRHIEQVARRVRAARLKRNRITVEQRRLARRLRTEHIIPIRAIARLRLPPSSLVRCARIPRARAKASQIADAGKLLATFAEPDRQLYVDDGLDQQFLRRILAAVEDLRAGEKDRLALPMFRWQAKHELARLLRRAWPVTEVIDALVAARLAAAPELLARWRAVSRAPRSSFIR